MDDNDIDVCTKSSDLDIRIKSSINHYKRKAQMVADYKLPLVLALNPEIDPNDHDAISIQCLNYAISGIAEFMLEGYI